MEPLRLKHTSADPAEIQDFCERALRLANEGESIEITVVVRKGDANKHRTYWASLTPEQRKARGRKSADTRKRKEQEADKTA